VLILEKKYVDNGSKAHQRDDIVFFFSWENVPGNDNQKIIEYLTNKICIDWVKTAQIEKVNGDNTIKISTDKNFLAFKLNDIKTELTLFIDDGTTNKFTVKMENGMLNIYREDREDRASEYKQWHRDMPNSKCYAWDVDFIEWRYREGKPIPVALTELTRADNGIIVDSSYLETIIWRYFVRDKQGEITKYLADKLGIPAYIILFRQCCTEFWVYDMEKKKWRESLSPLQMKKFIESL